MKYFRMLLILVLLVGGLGFYHQTARAGAFTYNSSINLQNLVNAVANITIHFYNQDGSENITAVTDTIPALGSKQYFPIQAGAGFDGSVVIESDAQIASISNILGNDGVAAASYVGSSSGGAPVLLPLLMKQNGGFSTWYNVQNAGSGPANVTVEYSDGQTASATIPVGAAHTFDQLAEGHAAGSVFSAVVSSDQPIAATVIEENTAIMFAYSGFIGTSTAPVMPLINAYNGPYVTGATIQNSGTVETTVTVSYTPNAGGGTACTETQAIPAGQNKTFALLAFAGLGADTDCVPLTKFVGSAKVTVNSADQPLTVIVNQLGAVNGEAYSGFNPDDATGTVIFPLLMNFNGGYWTSMNLMNVGGTTTTVTCEFTPYGGLTLPTPTATLAPNTGVNFLQPIDFGATTKYVGGATCTADNNGKIIGVVNEIGPSGTLDQLLVYEGFNIAP